MCCIVVHWETGNGFRQIQCTVPTGDGHGTFPDGRRTKVHTQQFQPKIAHFILSDLYIHQLPLLCRFRIVFMFSLT